MATLKDKGVSLRILDLGLDTRSPTGELILNMMGAVAQFERQMMLERQREGIAKAKADVILISGHNGGTGASPLTSTRASSRLEVYFTALPSRLMRIWRKRLASA